MESFAIFKSFVVDFFSGDLSFGKCSTAQKNIKSIVVISKQMLGYLEPNSGIG